MVSERRLAERMESYWSELTPHLSATVRRLNLSGYEEETAILKSGIAPARMFLVSEVAYAALADSYPKHVTLEVIQHSADIHAEAIVQRFSDKGPGDVIAPTLEQVELEFATSLARSMWAFLRRTFGIAAVQFSTPLSGHGFVDHVTVDAVANDILVEFKATTRPISSADLRQLLIYLTLAHFAQIPLNGVMLFNSRSGRSYSMTAHDLILSTSGVATVEFYHRCSDVFQRLMLEEQL